MSEQSYSRTCFFIYVFAIVVLSFTNYQEQHPDEWYQTLDVANLIVSGHSFSDTAYIHHRNLWASVMLSLPLALFRGVGIESPYLLFSFMKLCIGLLNFVVLWGMVRLWREEKPGCVFGERLIYACFCLTHISFFEAIRPSLEHFSSMMFWLMLGFWTYRMRKWAWVGVGFFAVMTGVVRYPSGILGFSFFIWQWLFLMSKGKYKENIFLTVGCLLGLFIGFSADLFLYGRVYESLYMYLMYNVFTELASLNFGSQSAFVYLDYFLKIFQPSYILVFPLFVFGFFKGLFETLKAYRSWSWIFILAFLAHVLPLHKEGRFISSFLFVIVFLAVYGVDPYLQVLWKKRKVQMFTAVMLGVGGLRMVEHTFYQMRGGRFLFSQTSYASDSCVVSYKWFPSFMLSDALLENKFGNFGVLDVQQKNITWLFPKKVQCERVQMIVTENFFNEVESYGCDLSMIPAYQNSFLSSLLSVKSFECAQDVLHENLQYRFDADLVKSSSFLRYENLPSLNFSALELKAWISKQEDFSKNVSL